MTRTISEAVAACLLGLALFVSGCLVVDNGNVTYSQKGKPVSGTTLSRVVEGETTRPELTALLGAPSRKTKGDGGAQVYVYEYREERKQDAQVFLIMMRKGQQDRHQRLYFQFKDDVVEKFWQD